MSNQAPQKEGNEGKEIWKWEGPPIRFEAGDLGGSAIMKFDLNNRKKIEISTEGSAHIRMEQNKKYTFDLNQKIKIENQTHWSKLKKRLSKNLEYIDVLFGVKGDDVHSHLGQSINSDSLADRFNRIQKGEKIQGKEYYDENSGAVVPLEKTISDTNTGATVELIFEIDSINKIIKVKNFSFN